MCIVKVNMNSDKHDLMWSENRAESSTLVGNHYVSIILVSSNTTWTIQESAGCTASCGFLFFLYVYEEYPQVTIAIHNC